jgi:hypothetical protein
VAEAGSLFDFDYDTWAETARSWLAQDLALAKRGRDAWMTYCTASSAVPRDVLEDLLAQYDLWEVKNEALSEWVGVAAHWAMESNLTLEEELSFISGPHLAKAEQALAQIADLGE